MKRNFSNIHVPLLHKTADVGRVTVEVGGRNKSNIRQVYSTVSLGLRGGKHQYVFVPTIPFLWKCVVVVGVGGVGGGVSILGADRALSSSPSAQLVPVLH